METVGSRQKHVINWQENRSLLVLIICCWAI